MSFDAWLAFRAGERVDNRPNICTECDKPIPEDDDVIEWQDGSGFVCEKCNSENH